MATDDHQERSTAAERRDEILDAALIEFAERGLHGTSTERIAKRAGISQPYVFQALRHEEGTVHRERRALHGADARNVP